MDAADAAKGDVIASTAHSIAAPLSQATISLLKGSTSDTAQMINSIHAAPVRSTLVPAAPTQTRKDVVLGATASTVGNVEAMAPTGTIITAERFDVVSSADLSAGSPAATATTFTTAIHISNVLVNANATDKSMVTDAVGIIVDSNIGGSESANEAIKVERKNVSITNDDNVMIKPMKKSDRLSYTGEHSLWIVLSYFSSRSHRYLMEFTKRPTEIKLVAEGGSASSFTATMDQSKTPTANFQPVRSSDSPLPSHRIDLSSEGALECSSGNAHREGSYACDKSTITQEHQEVKSSPEAIVKAKADQLDTGEGTSVISLSLA